MTKKEAKKKKTSSKNKTKKNKEIERILIENFVDLQKVMTKLSEKFEFLSGKISELLELFEESAKVLVKKEIEMGKSDKYKEDLLNKIEKLLEQNKVIAKGLTLMHEHNLENKNNDEDNFKMHPPIPNPSSSKSSQNQLEIPPPPQKNQEYQKSPNIQDDSNEKLNNRGPLKARTQEKPSSDKNQVFEMPQ